MPKNKKNFDPELDTESRRFPFTWFNYPENPSQVLSEYKKIRYFIGGYEICPESGRPHIQGYAEFWDQFSIRRLAKQNKTKNNTISWRIAKGDQTSNKNYCSKDATNIFTWGAAQHQGKRTDLDETRNKALDIGMRGVTLHSNFQQFKVAQAFLSYHEVQRDWPIHVTWYWGASGAGKSRKMFTENPDAYILETSSNPIWWEGYDAHDTVLIDDVDKNTFQFKYLLRLLDRHPLRVFFKGGSRQLLSRKMFITSLENPLSWDYRGQIKRRIHELIEIKYSEVGGNISEELENSSAPTSTKSEDWDPYDESD